MDSAGATTRLGRACRTDPELYLYTTNFQELHTGLEHSQDMEILEPRVTKRERKLHLSYELPHRIHCSKIYPTAAPNGSTVILYGHDRGLRLLWRGGRRLKESSTARSQANGTSKDKDVEVIVIDSDDDEPQKAAATDDQEQYEENEEEQDPDCPYPSVVQDLDVELGSDVLQMAVPSLISVETSRVPRLAKKNITIALGRADGRVTVMSIPLRPPRSENKQEFVDSEISELHLEGNSSISHGLTIKVLPKNDEQTTTGRLQSDAHVANSDGRILVAAVSSTLDIWSLSLTADSILQSPEPLRPLYHATVPGNQVSFQSSPRSHHILFGDRTGIVRIYDPFPPKSSTSRPSSRDSIPDNREEAGRWLMSYHTPYHSPKDSPALSRRKRVLDVAWVLAGRAILALLEDGEWGIWDLAGPTQPGKNVEDFAIHGYLGSSTPSEVADAGKQKRGGPKLAPMTPNTRKVKAEKLFTGPPKKPGVAATGGISVSTTTTRAGQVDEGVVMWYGSDIYSINSMQTFWQRSTTNSNSGFGSLYAPGLTHISEINLINESITSISQFAPTTSTTALGQMNTQRDLLVSAEHRFVVLQSLKPAALTRDALSQAVERPGSRDQRMLDAGELDLGGVDRMLDNMAGEARTRRVGFAH